MQETRNADGEIFADVENASKPLSHVSLIKAKAYAAGDNFFRENA